MNGLQSNQRAGIQKDKKKARVSYVLSARGQLRFRDINTLNLKRRKKIRHENSNHRRVEVAIRIAAKIDVKAKNYHRQREMF